MLARHLFELIYCTVEFLLRLGFLHKASLHHVLVRAYLLFVCLNSLFHTLFLDKADSILSRSILLYVVSRLRHLIIFPQVFHVKQRIQTRVDVHNLLLSRKPYPFPLVLHLDKAFPFHLFRSQLLMGFFLIEKRVRGRLNNEIFTEIVFVESWCSNAPLLFSRLAPCCLLAHLAQALLRTRQSSLLIVDVIQLSRSLLDLL